MLSKHSSWRRALVYVSLLPLFLRPIRVCGQTTDKVLFVQPIQVRNNSGGSPANPAMQVYQAATDKIYAQANVDVNFLPFSTFNSTSSLTIANNAAFNALVTTAGHGQNSNANVLNMWFVNTLPAEDGRTTFGLGRQNANGFAIANNTFTKNRIDTIGHEMGHNLGLDHTTFGAGAANNLMTAGDTRTVPGSLADINPDGLKLDRLTAAQIAQIRGSAFLRPVINSTLIRRNGQVPWSDPTDWTNVPNVKAAPNNDPKVGVFNVDTNLGRIWLDISATINRYTQKGGTVSTFKGFNGPDSGATLTVIKAFNWSGGTIAGKGTTTSQGTLTITGDPLLAGSSTVNNLGTATLTNGNLNGSNAAVFNNAANATFTVTDDSSFGALGAKKPIFNNQGKFDKSGGAAPKATSMNWVFNNNGRTLVRSGQLILAGGGSGTGVFIVTGGDTLTFANSYTAGGLVSGNGNVSVTRGTVDFKGGYSIGGSTTVKNAVANFSAPITRVGNNLTVTATAGQTATADLAAGFNVGTLTLNGVTGNQPVLKVKGDVTVSNPIAWSGGTMTGEGTTTAKGGLNISQITSLNGRTLVNEGTANLNGAARLYGDNGAKFENKAGATLDFKADGGLAKGEGAAPALKNAGTLGKSGGTGTSEIAWRFTNSGNVEGKKGTLSFTAGYTQTAGKTVVSAGATIASKTNMDIQGGRILGDGTIQAPNVRNNAIIKAGMSPGTLTIAGNLLLLGSSTMESQLGGLVQGRQYDFLDVQGHARLGGDLSIDFLNGFQHSVTPRDTFFLLEANSPLSGIYADVANGGRLRTSDGYGSFQVNYGPANEFNSHDVVLSNFSAVPEPSSVVLLGIALLLLTLYAYRRLAIGRQGVSLLRFPALIATGALVLTASSSKADPIHFVDLKGQPLSREPGDVDKAIQAFRERDYDRCFQLLQAAGKQRADLVPARLMLAQFFLLDNQTALGRAALEQAAIEHPDHPAGYLLFGQLALREGRTTDARLHFDRAATLISSNTWNCGSKRAFQVQARAGLASVAERRQDWKAAEAALADWLALDPKNGEVRQRLAMTLFRQGQKDKALEQLERAVADKPELESAAITMAHLYTEQGDLKKAAEWMERAVAVDPRAHLSYARWLVQQNRLGEARNHAEQACQIEPEANEVKFLQGLIAWQLKDYETAERIFLPLSQESPGNFLASDHLALALVEQPMDAKRRRGLELAEVNAGLYPNSGEALGTLGLAYYRVGRLAESEQTLRAALGTGGVTSDAVYCLARVVSERGRSDEIKPLLKAALDAAGPFRFRKEAQEWFEELAKKP
jgi:tetratricopeptide (TPR) repeat protein